MPVKILQKIRDQAILLGPRPPQAEDRHVLVVGHDDPMIVRLHFTPFSSSRRNQCYYPSIRKIPRNFQSTKLPKIVDTTHFTKIRVAIFSGGGGRRGKKEKCQGVRMFICLEASPW